MAYKLKFCQTILIYMENDLPKSLHPRLLPNVFSPSCFQIMIAFDCFFFFFWNPWLTLVMIAE